MNQYLSALSRVRRRVIFPALAATVAVGTLVGGLEHASFLSGSDQPKEANPSAEPALTSLTAALAAAASGVTGVADPSSTASRSTLDTDLEHPGIDRWVSRLTGSAKRDFQNSLNRMDKYAAMINAKIDARQMPRELIYLALIESNFNPVARSPVSAVGLWQFMSGTARQFGLTVGRGTDERKDPAKATDAALTYLTHLHERFGSWYLAAAAYNSGPGTVSKALYAVTGRRTGSDADFFRIMPRLPRETQDYVPKLIASARVAMDKELYGLE